MSVYKPKGSPFYHFDFQWRGRRYSGSTRKTSRRDAERVERDERARIEREVSLSYPTQRSLLLKDVAAHYWNEVGQHHAGASNTERDLARLVAYFGSKTLPEITDSEVAAFVTLRRGHKSHGKPLSNATVNRTGVDLLRKVFSHAARAWDVKLPKVPSWGTHRLREPAEVVRELVGDEWQRILLATPIDYKPLVTFARMTGLRLSECLLKWEHVDFDALVISRRGKGGALVTTPITSAVIDLLWPLLDQDPTWVFTYRAKRGRDGRTKGKRYPITVSGLKTTWRRIVKRAKVKGFRFHDLRHDFATKLLREVGDIRIVQRALNHSSMSTTMRYAHVLDDDVAAALERLHESQNRSRKAQS